MTELNDRSLPVLCSCIFYHIPYSCFPCFISFLLFCTLACKKIGNLEEKQGNADGWYVVLSVPRDLSKKPAMFCSKPWHCKYDRTLCSISGRYFGCPLFLSFVRAQSMSVTWEGKKICPYLDSVSWLHHRQWKLKTTGASPEPVHRERENNQVAT